MFNTIAPAIALYMCTLVLLFSHFESCVRPGSAVDLYAAKGLSGTGGFEVGGLFSVVTVKTMDPGFSPTQTK